MLVRRFRPDLHVVYISEFQAILFSKSRVYAKV